MRKVLTVSVVCALLMIACVAIAEPPILNVAGDRADHDMGPIAIQAELVDYGGAPWSMADARRSYWVFGELTVSADQAVIRWTCQTDRSGERSFIERNEPALVMPWNDDIQTYAAMVPIAGGSGVWQTVALTLDLDTATARLDAGVLRYSGACCPWYEWSPDYYWQEEAVAEQTMEPHAHLQQRARPGS